MIESTKISEFFLSKSLFKEEYEEIDPCNDINPSIDFTLSTAMEFDYRIQYPISPGFRIMKGNADFDNNLDQFLIEENDWKVIPVKPHEETSLIKENAIEHKPSISYEAFQSIDFDEFRKKIANKASLPNDSQINDFDSWLAIVDEPTEEDKNNTVEKKTADLYKSKLRGGEEREVHTVSLNTIESFHFHERRWGKDEDRNLYKLLLELERNNVINIADLSKQSISKEVKNMMKIICRKCGWIGPYSLFHRRIKNMLRQSSFSARELILLKRILRKEFKFVNLDYELIASRFPGKAIPYIVSTWERIIAERQ